MFNTGLQSPHFAISALQSLLFVSTKPQSQPGGGISNWHDLAPGGTLDNSWQVGGQSGTGGGGGGGALNGIKGRASRFLDARFAASQAALKLFT
jgi:hypothetical protein